MCEYQRKVENESHKLTYYSSLQPVVAYNFSETEKAFPVSF